MDNFKDWLAAALKEISKQLEGKGVSIECLKSEANFTKYLGTGIEEQEDRTLHMLQKGLITNHQDNY